MRAIFKKHGSEEKKRVQTNVVGFYSSVFQRLFYSTYSPLLETSPQLLTDRCVQLADRGEAERQEVRKDHKRKVSLAVDGPKGVLHHERMSVVV